MRLTVAEAASLLNAPVAQVHDWIEDGGLPAQRIGGRYLINRTELLEWTTGREVALAPRAFAQTLGGSVADSVAEALRDGAIDYAVPAPDAAAVVRHIVDSLRLADEGDRDSLQHFILGRDALGLALVGDRIAIPHVRTPAVLPVSGEGGSRLSLSFLQRPLKLGDTARVVETIFFLVSPTVTAHLALLARLAWCLNDSAFRDAITVRSSRDEILSAAAGAEARL